VRGAGSGYAFGMIHLLLLAFGLPLLLAQDARTPEATSLLGKPLYAPQRSAEAQAALDKDLADARARLEKDPGNADAAIWVGRRLGYLGRYRDTIAAFTTAIAAHPNDPRMYRHRGHRYISVREFDKAAADLAKAAALVASREDEVEPDGQPNAKNIPTSTLKTNIYYHLGLAHYLRGDFAAAADAYRLCMAHAKNPDMQVATAHWQYMTLRRLKRDADAAKVLEPITADMPIIENGSYHRLLMMYKGATAPDALLAASKAEALDAVTIGYGVANWHLYNGRQSAARDILTSIVEQHASTQWAGFGYIAAEADLARLR
jgi:tetratricopeptide (TPR) repeat protein